MFRSSRLRMIVAGGAALALLAACGSDDDDGDDAAAQAPTAEEADDDDDDEPDLSDLPELEQVNIGYVSAVDQMGVAMALDIGFYDELDLDVTLADPFPTGVDALNALDSGDVDFVQVGVPSFGAILGGMDLVYLGNYSGSASQLTQDEPMALVARADSGIDSDDLTTLAGKRLGVSEGTINHLYVLRILEEAGLTSDDVEIINTPPPEMGVALETEGVDAIASWDPWPITIEDTVSGSYEVVRGGGYMAFLGYIVSTRSYVEENPDIVERVLTARAAADQWMRDNTEEAAAVTVRWVPGTEVDVAEEAMQYQVAWLDGRFSACNYLALDLMLQAYNDLGFLDGTYDPNDHFYPGPILNVMEQHPEYFDDLPEIPEAAAIDAGYTYDRQEATAACPQG
ncbi:ABC transporter substrate-binding protein [Phytoactinopolyspora limicola]|uniref:ABC transporter substrate-binding protein n=1 Tax=Phytoactinopolyspora limicola TaxID=2715536 RepID=UPI001A9C8A7C|nr:NrtA/SsuA/CpmA family ABC transporter substrate-binding protein [Phytoactinopolyspora limicola]